MLGSLARKLRAAGVDTAYLRTGGIEEALKVCRRERRVLVTCNAGLWELARARGVDAIAVRGDGDAALLSSLARGARAAGIGLRRGDPRCSLCNGRLVRLQRAEVAGRVDRAISQRHREFFSCSRCGHLYWKGSHWKKLRSVGRLLPRG